MTVAAPSAGQVAGNEVKNLPADVTTNKQPTHDTVEATQIIDNAVPDASGDKSTSVSNTVDIAPTQETTPAKAVPDPELGEGPAAPSPPSTDASAPPPLPEKDAAVTNGPTTPTPDETSASPSQTAEPAPTEVEDVNKTEEPPAQPTEPGTENADSSQVDAVEDGPKPQSGGDGDDRAVGEGSAKQNDDGKANGGTKLTLHTDRVREMSTASIMTASSSTPGTPAEELASSAVDEEESGTPTLTKSQKKKLRRKLNKNKGEKNSPHTPSAETVRNTDNSTIQDRKFPIVATTAPVDIPGGEGDGELVEKEASGEEDAPVIVEKGDIGEEDSAVKVKKPPAEAGKTADGSGDSSTDEWLDW